jgi:hypothetical protein
VRKRPGRAGTKETLSVSVDPEAKRALRALQQPLGLDCAFL